MRQVLMVDDDPGQLRIREIILRNAGLTANVATDEVTALSCLRAKSGEIGVLVTDHNLPGCSGAELVREARAISPSLPVVVLTGMPGIESCYEGLDVTFCFKPMPPNEFIEVVQRLVGE
jgi:two-component system response regulator HydG